ncbi:MAG: transposase [Pseudomonadota bacterium]
MLVDHIDALRMAVARTRAERPFHMDAFVVLPDHVHAVWILPEGDAAYSTRWRIIKSRFTRSVLGMVSAEHPPYVSRSKRMKRERGIWQRRFWEHHIRSDEEYAACVRYCLTNPVKHELVERPEDWPYSSIHRDIREGRWAA